MTAKRVDKEALIAETITFTPETSDDKLDPNLINNYIDVISLDGLGGSVVTPTAGTYEITYKTDENGGFKSITDNGSLAATKTGGSGLADGVAEGASFVGLPIAIKIVPTSTDVAVAYRVFIKQSS